MRDIHVNLILLSVAYILMFTDEVGSRFDYSSSEKGLHEAEQHRNWELWYIEVEFILYVLDSSLSFTSQNFNFRVYVYRNHEQHAILCNGEVLSANSSF